STDLKTRINFPRCSRFTRTSRRVSRIMSYSFNFERRELSGWKPLLSSKRGAKMVSRLYSLKPRKRAFRRELLHGHKRDIREERVKSLHHRRVRENGVAELRIWQVCEHRRLHRGHDLTGVGANHREAENAVVIPTHKSLHEALSFSGCLRPQYNVRRQFR